jgi:dTDP-4-dehydrorhamnose 3,5-epimerase
LRAPEPRGADDWDVQVEIQHFDIEGPILFLPRRHGDSRGFFSEVFRQDVFEAHAGPTTFVQDNHSRSATKGTLRGLHYQAPPATQGKLVRVTRGAVLDVAVDIRKSSKTYGQHVAVELTAENWQQLWVPGGFLHGFCTLTDDVEFLYKVTAYYSPEHDGAVAWNDPDIGIRWPFAETGMTLSPKDRAAPRLRDLPPIF